MKMIAAADRKGGIGRDGGLLANLPGDMKYFREQTAGAVVIMGRKTLESFPGGRPLKGRRNIVLSRTMDVQPDAGYEVCRSAEEAVALVAGEVERPVFVIGGGEIYQLMLPYCEEALITEIDADLNADTFIPIFSEMEGWYAASRGETAEDNGISYTFVVYKRG